MVKVYVDSHEPEHIVKELKKLNLDVEVIPLETGDYQIGDILIERKTAGDLLSSIRDGRLFDQLYRLMILRSKGMKPVVAVTGTLPKFDYFTKRKPTKERYMQMLATENNILKTMAFSYSVPYVKFSNDASFIVELQKLAKNLDKQKDRPVYKTANAGEHPISDIKSDMLSQIPTIGRKISSMLSEKYTVKELASMKQEELEALEVGERPLKDRGKHIWEALNK